METKKEDGQVLPIILLSNDNRIIWAGITNEKGYKKSLEQSELWALNSGTGKLIALVDHDARFVSGKYLDSIEKLNLTGTQGLYLAYSKKLANLASSVLFDRETLTKTVASQSTEQTHVETTQPNKQTSADKDKKSSTVLHDLESLVAERKKTMPEGSYTSHLFKAGLSKIRKKTGEEAVELILAQDKAEIKSEAADLLYHLIVLLAASEVGLDDVLEELSSR